MAPLWELQDKEGPGVPDYTHTHSPHTVQLIIYKHIHNGTHAHSFSHTLECTIYSHMYLWAYTDIHTHSFTHLYVHTHTASRDSQDLLWVPSVPWADSPSIGQNRHDHPPAPHAPMAKFHLRLGALVPFHRLEQWAWEKHTGHSPVGRLCLLGISHVIISTSPDV